MRVLEWWQSVWRSPMAAEFLDAELRGGMYLLAELHQKRWTAESTTELLEVAKEIRLQEARFGLSPIDRRRLQWQVGKGEGGTSPSSSSPKRERSPRRPVKDPRSVLKAV